MNISPLDVAEVGDSRLPDLERNTSALPPFPPELGRSNGMGPHCVEHQMDCGTSFSWSLLSRDEVSCAKWFLSAGTQFPRHAHEQREWLIVFRGTLMLYVQGERRDLKEGEYAVVEPGVEHWARTLTDTEFLAVTVPSCPDWPR